MKARVLITAVAALLAFAPAASADLGVQLRFDTVAPPEAGEFEGPDDLAADADGNVFVVFRDLVQRYDANGSLAAVWPGLGFDPSAIELDGLGHVYVSHPAGDRVLKFTTDGTLVATLTGFREPLRLGSDAAGNLYVSEGHGFRPSDPFPGPLPQLHKLSPSGEVLAQRARSLYIDLSVTPEGRVYMPWFDESIGWLDPAHLVPGSPPYTGVFAMAFGDRPDYKGNFLDSCCGLAALGGHVWVARSVVNLIEAYEPGGRLVQACPSGGHVDGMAAGRDGRLYVLQGRTVVRYGEGAPPCDIAAPQVTNLRLSRRVLRVSSFRRLRGAGLYFSTSEQATAEITFTRRLAGRREGGRCRRPARRNRGRKPCLRRRVEARFDGIESTVVDGASVRLVDLLWRERLPAGRYEIAVTATDRAGHTSTPALARARVTR